VQVLHYIVADDIWSVEIWDIIKCAIPRNSCGSGIIKTTCIKHVFESCCSSYGDHDYELRSLRPVHSKRFFLIYMEIMSTKLLDMVLGIVWWFGDEVR